jgi:hypothetical protein
VSFFAPLPEPEREREVIDYRSPPWSGAPENELPVAIALDVVLVRTDAIAVYVTSARVFSTGLAFDVAMVRRRPVSSAEDRRGGFLLHGESDGEAARLGVAFADGRRTTLDAAWSGRVEAPEIQLQSGGGGGGFRRWDARVWLWPIPPQGPLTFAFVWPRAGVDETLVEVDSAPIRDSAPRAVELWPDDRPLPPRHDGPGWAAYGAA